MKESIPNVIFGIESISNRFEFKTLISVRVKWGVKKELLEFIDLKFNEYSGTKILSKIFMAMLGLNIIKEYKVKSSNTREPNK